LHTNIIFLLVYTHTHTHIHTQVLNYKEAERNHQKSLNSLI
jgi:hypothetical protein